MATVPEGSPFNPVFSQAQQSISQLVQTISTIHFPGNPDSRAINPSQPSKTQSRPTVKNIPLSGTQNPPAPANPPLNFGYWAGVAFFLVLSLGGISVVALLSVGSVLQPFLIGAYTSLGGVLQSLPVPWSDSPTVSIEDLLLPKVKARRFLELMHWGTATCLLVLFLGGFVMANLPNKTSIFQRLLFIPIHQSLGLLVLGLLSVRMFLLLRTSFPLRWPKRPVDWINTIALNTNIYFFMLVLPISGYLLANNLGRSVAFFGTRLPTFFPKGAGFEMLGHTQHFWLSYICLSLIAAHTLVQRRYLVARWNKYFGPKKKPS
ncbi:cytochrome b [Anthocerotibacter panamensis]|uniref:cytochrome b n=1 Tax=Anthocerotibacter panamensis TaxID=2857077 RepID=UPI001C4085B7|nr:cytochrome b/b6 domain-containing protein [Anthocerotibacter panamensis]